MLPAFRQVRRAPGYSFALVLSLTIGVAATCTSFAVVKRATLDPLPYPDPDRLVTIRTVVNGRTSLGGSYRFGEDLRGRGVFADVSADWGRTVTFETPGASQRVPGGAVTANYFDVMGYEPAFGATLTPGAADEVVVSWAFFDRALGGDPRVIGSSIVLDGVAHRVVGVMPKGFVAPYLSEAQVWTPLDVRPFQHEAARGQRSVVLQARLADGVTLSRARAFLAAFGEQQRTQYPQAYGRQTWVVDRLRDVLIEPSRTLLIGMAGAAMLLMLTVVGNIAGLSATRATEVRRSYAVRLALGAGRARLLREQLSEILLLATAGTATGLWLAALSITRVVAHQQQFQLFLEDVPSAAFDLPVAAIGVLLGLAAAGVAAVAPQRVAATVTAEELLGTSRSAGHAKTNRARGALVVLQVAMATVLVFSAGLLVRTMARIDAAPLGFEAEGLVQFSVTLPASRYGTGTRAQQFETEMLERLRGIDGVAAATATLRMPSLGGPEVSITLQGRSEVEGGRAVHFAVAPGFFHFLGVPLREGREFASSDSASTARVAVVSESAARTLWPDGRVIGQRLRLGGAGTAQRDVTVIGIVGDVRQDGPARDVRPTIYESTLQRDTLTRTFVWRASRPVAGMAADVRAAVVTVDPLLAPTNVEMLEARIDSQVVQQRFVRSLITIVAMIAASLSLLGLFAVVSLAAFARRHEFAIRIALGARSVQVALLVMRHALVLGLAGLAGGVLAAFWLVDTLRAMLTHVSTTDPLTLTVTALMLLGLSVLAALPPAIRAMRIDPMKVLKAD